MRDFLRFVLSSADQARIDPASLQFEEQPYLLNTAHPPFFGPQALKISFRITNPTAGAPQIRPLFPGSLRFVAQPGSAGNLPEPDAVDLALGYPGWRTLGALMVRIKQKDVEAGLAEHAPDLPVMPTTAWFAPIRLSPAFLLSTLASGGLARAKVARKKKSPIQPSSPDWAKHAVSRFLQGSYEPELRLGASETDDDVVKHAMPTVDMASDGSVTIYVSMARTQENPQDGAAKVLDEFQPTLARTHPTHPINAAIPARLVYREIGSHLLDGLLVRAGWPFVRRYFPLFVTRTWQRVPNFSVQFPGRSITLSVGGAPQEDHPLPAHGVVFIPQDPSTSLPSPPTITVHGIAGKPATFLDGRTAEAWRAKASTAAFTFDLNLPDPPVPHVILRRTMREEMYVDPVFPDPGGGRCTYMSMRRSTRAFVDHRVTGGRLFWEGRKTSPVTKALMKDAWTVIGAGKDPTRKVENVLANKRPDPAGSPGLARHLEFIWRIFFHEEVPPVDVDGDGNTHRDDDKKYDGGQVMYALWQTFDTNQRAEGSKRNFANEVVGCGGAGAIVAVGLGTFLVRPPHAPMNDAVMDQNTIDMMDGRLVPGSALQFWDDHDYYVSLRQRRRPSAADDNGGHSPLFHRYEGSTSPHPAIFIVDQNNDEPTRCPRTAANRITWYGTVRDIWIAAAWNE